jgi:hypothetical protein
MNVLTTRPWFRKMVIVIQITLDITNSIIATTVSMMISFRVVLSIVSGDGMASFFQQEFIKTVFKLTPLVTPYSEFYTIH